MLYKSIKQISLILLILTDSYAKILSNTSLWEHRKLPYIGKRTATVDNESQKLLS